jgi:hypothetical protein
MRCTHVVPDFGAAEITTSPGRGRYLSQYVLSMKKFRYARRGACRRVVRTPAECAGIAVGQR